MVTLKTKVPLEEVIRGILGFFLMMLACLALLYTFPQITLALLGLFIAL